MEFDSFVLVVDSCRSVCLSVGRSVGRSVGWSVGLVEAREEREPFQNRTERRVDEDLGVMTTLSSLLSSRKAFDIGIRQNSDVF